MLAIVAEESLADTKRAVSNQGSRTRSSRANLVRGVTSNKGEGEFFHRPQFIPLSHPTLNHDVKSLESIVEVISRDDIRSTKGPRNTEGPIDDVTCCYSKCSGTRGSHKM